MMIENWQTVVDGCMVAALGAIVRSAWQSGAAMAAMRTEITDHKAEADKFHAWVQDEVRDLRRAQ